MNKKVLKAMIALVMIFLVALYVLKIFFPEQFVMVIENERLVVIGNYIDSHTWAYYTFGVCSSFITYWLYCSAVCQRWYLKWWEVLVVLATIGASILLNHYDINLYTALSYLSFVFLPCIFGSDLKRVTICYSVHLVSQMLTLSIRNIPMYMTHVNTLMIHMVGLESFLWLVLFYVLYNYKNKEA